MAHCNVGNFTQYHQGLPGIAAMKGEQHNRVLAKGRDIVRALPDQDDFLVNIFLLTLEYSYIIANM
jgi:hypothetical protein